MGTISTNSSISSVYYIRQFHYNKSMKINFDRLEARLKKFVESSSRLISTEPDKVDERSSRLAVAVKKYFEDTFQSSETLLPASILIEIPESQADTWKGFPFKSTLQSIFMDAGFDSTALPDFSVLSSPSVLDGEIILRDAEQGPPPLDRTASMQSVASTNDDILGDAFPSNAFLIVNGLETIPLTKPVCNIGRRLENDLVVEDPRISREHAQIRAIKGQFVIFDLNSTGGTFVNSVRITKQPLFPGDVISLAGVPLVYGQDAPTPFTRTGPVEPFFSPTKDKEGL